MNEKVKKVWLKALRSGKYEQAQQNLGWCDEKAQYEKVIARPDSFCCLGVLCHLSGKAEWVQQTGTHGAWYDGELDYLPSSVISWSQLMSMSQTQTLIIMNDSGSSFLEIADYIENNL